MSRRRGRVNRRGRVTQYPSQPASMYFGYPPTGADAYAYPGALVIAGRDQYNHSLFQAVSAGGGTVLLYLDAIVLNAYGTYHDLLFNSSVYGGAVPQWGSYTANATGPLADFRTTADGGGGVLLAKLPGVLEKAVADNPHIGGFFADDVGTMSWFPNLAWSSMPPADQTAYRNGAIAVAQAFRNVCDNHGLMFIVNGTWHAGTLAGNGGGYPTMTTPGCSLADGGVVEHHDGDSLSFWGPYVTSSQWGSASKITQGKGFCWAIMNTSAGFSTFLADGRFPYISQQVTDPDYDGVPPWGAGHPTGLPSRVRY